MQEKKYTKEDCLSLLQDKAAALKQAGEHRYPKRNDFAACEVVAIKAFLGPWPRALEAAGVKPPRDTDRLARNREKRIRAKRVRREAEKKQKEEQKAALDWLLSLARQEGFVNAAVLPTEQVIFDPSFRPYCEENLCGQYGTNHSCPPSCGTPEQMRQRVLAYRYILVLQTEWPIASFEEQEKLFAARRSHNAAMFRLIEQCRVRGMAGFMIGASGCMLCRPCAMAEGKPCRYPDKQYSCMSAFCIHVKRLAESGHIPYDYRDGILPFFGAFVFDRSI